MSWVNDNWKQLVCFLAGAALIVTAFFDLVRFREVDTIVASIVAGGVAFSINETVSQRRQREAEAALRERREKDYDAVLSHLIKSFTEKGSPYAEDDVRRIIATRASQEFVTAYQEWRHSISGLESKGGESKDIPNDRRSHIEAALAEVYIPARKDLGVETETPSVETGMPPGVGPGSMRAAVPSMGTDFSILSRAAVPER